MSSEKEFRHESMQDRGSIVKYLKALSDGFERGELTFQKSSDHIILNPDGLIQLEIKAHRKPEKSRLTLKFSWKEKTNLKLDKDETLIINSGRQ